VSLGTSELAGLAVVASVLVSPGSALACTLALRRRGRMLRRTSTSRASAQRTWRSAAPQSIEAHMAKHMCANLTSLRRLQQSLVMPRLSPDLLCAPLEDAVAAPRLRWAAVSACRRGSRGQVS